MKKKLGLFFSLNPFSITFYLTIIIIIVFLIGPSFLEIIELKTLDLRFLSRGIIKGNDSIVLAVIDEKSLDKEGRWPWPRSKFAKLIDTLSRDGAKVVGLDVGFLEPDENTNLKLIRQFKQKLDSLKINNSQINKFMDQAKLIADNDLALANSLERSKAKVVLGYFFHMTQKEIEYRIQEKQIQNQLDRIRNSKYPLIMYDQQEMDIDPFLTAYAPESNLKILSRAADSSGYFNMMPDKDGVVRWMPLAIKCGKEVYSPLSIQSAWHYLDKPQMMVEVANYGIEGVRIGKISIPTDEQGRMLINYCGPKKTFPHYSITDIINGNLPEGLFKDKIVLVGATSVGIYDMRNTPFSPVYPGLEIHATVISNILNQNFLAHPKWTKVLDLMVIIFMGVIIGFIIPRLSALRAAPFALGLFLAHIFFSRLLFVRYGIWFNITYPLLALIVLYVSLTVYKYLTEERERKKIKGAFTYYVSSSVVNEMLKHPEKLKLGGDRKELSVLFSDIRGFTTIAEGMTPEDLVHLLNEYLTVMTDIVFKYEGTLDKYIGDAIMALYGAPLDLPDHAERACRSALDMVEELKELNRKWVSEGKQPMDIGIGINTGPMMVGNMGSEQRFDFTAMGDAVNLSSRLEGANKSYKTSIIISESTHEQIKGKFTCMELDLVRVKGRTKPIKIYSLVGYGDLTDIKSDIVNQFNNAVNLYRNRNWAEAMRIFENITALDPDMYAARIYIERCNELKENPPPEEWDGVFVMTTK